MKAEKLWFDNEQIYVETEDKQIGSMPLSWFKNLKDASLSELLEYELWSNNSWIHWEQLGEDLSVDGFFKFKK